MSRISKPKYPVKPNIYFQISGDDDFDKTKYKTIDECIINTIFNDEIFSKCFKNRYLRDICSSIIDNKSLTKSTNIKRYDNNSLKASKLFYINIKVASQLTKNDFDKIAKKLWDLIGDNYPYTEKISYRDEKEEYEYIRPSQLSINDECKSLFD